MKTTECLLCNFLNLRCCVIIFSVQYQILLFTHRVDFHQHDGVLKNWNPASLRFSIFFKRHHSGNTWAEMSFTWFLATEVTVHGERPRDCYLRQAGKWFIQFPMHFNDFPMCFLCGAYLLSGLTSCMLPRLIVNWRWLRQRYYRYFTFFRILNTVNQCYWNVIAAERA